MDKTQAAMKAKITLAKSDYPYTRIQTREDNLTCLPAAEYIPPASWRVEHIVITGWPNSWSARHLNDYIKESSDLSPEEILNAVRTWIESNSEEKACF